MFNQDASSLQPLTFTAADGTASATYWGFELILPPGSYVIKAYPTGGYSEGYLYGRVNRLEDGANIQSWHPVYGPDMSEKPAVFTEWVRVVIYYAQSIESGSPIDHAQIWFSRFNIQLERGNTATAFEPYNGETFELTAGNFLSTATVPALPGVNNILADTGEVTVTGKADPTAVINKLTKAGKNLTGEVAVASVTE